MGRRSLCAFFIAEEEKKNPSISVFVKASGVLLMLQCLCPSSGLLASERRLSIRVPLLDCLYHLSPTAEPMEKYFLSSSNGCLIMAAGHWPQGMQAAGESGVLPTLRTLRGSLPRPRALSLFSMGLCICGSLLNMQGTLYPCRLLLCPLSFPLKTLLLQQSLLSIYKKLPSHLSYQLAPIPPC